MSNFNSASRSFNSKSCWDEKSSDVYDFFYFARKTNLDHAGPGDEEFCSWVLGCSHLESLWYTCHRPDWILRVVDSANSVGILRPVDESGLRLFACWCACAGWSDRSASRETEAIETALRYAKGQTSRE